ncbi:MAG: hypothetical protein QGH42_09735 [Kiritimatiellia bacterium]|jgi:hypothetical protein|nr:hypothetical protein [Kiritimatiellia bacterium]MDP6631209.1 hypothetical protein [Kiritimatiellia bacterium]MDP6811437.1 hypothetical protein [Kiritimatiellia bacterium]MDP7024503.1 hypothetical protein [Kiritimatiellia bacterium]
MTLDTETATATSATGSPQVSRRFCFLLLGALCIATAFTSLTHCRYTITGDSRVFFGEVRALRHGYLGTNFRALIADLKGQQGEHISLKTEGGFAVLLATARVISERSPFLLNAALLPLLFLALMLLAAALSRDRNTAMLSAVLGLLFILIHPQVATATWKLTLPLRDALAHLLGTLGLLVCVCAAPGRPHRGPKLMAAGILIGLASWSRLTSVLLVIPAGLYTVTAAGPLDLRKRATAMLWLGAGLVIGLCPLACQNIIEGRAAYQLGGIARLVRESVHPAEGELHRAKHGLRLSKFPIMAPKLARKILAAHAPWFKVLTSIAIVMALLKHVRRVILLLGSALVIFLLYGCYSVVVVRYIISAHWFLMLLPSIWLAETVGLLLDRVRGKARCFLSPGTISTVLALVTALLCLRQIGDTQRSRETWQTAMRFKTWLSQTFDKTDLFIAKGNSVAPWIWYFAYHDTPPHTGWRWTRDNTNPKGISQEFMQRLERAIEEDRNAYFINEIFRDGDERRSWWKDDLQNDYRLIPHDARFEFPDGRSLKPYRIVRPQDRSARLSVHTEQEEVRKLFLWSRSLATTNRWQAITISHPDWPASGTHALQMGPNIITLPYPLPTGTSELTMESTAPLPAVLHLEVMTQEPIVTSFQDQKSAPSLSRAFSDLYVRWRGYRQWWRDRGGDRNAKTGKPKHQSCPMFFISDGSNMRIPKTTDDLHIRVVLTASSSSKLSQARLTDGIGYSVDGTQLSPSTTVKQRNEGAGRGGSSEHVVDFMQSIIVPARALSGSAADLVFRIDLAAEACDWLHIWHVEFETTEPVAGAPQS